MVVVIQVGVLGVQLSYATRANRLKFMQVSKKKKRREVYACASIPSIVIIALCGSKQVAQQTEAPTTNAYSSGHLSNPQPQDTEMDKIKS